MKIRKEKVQKQERLYMAFMFFIIMFSFAYVFSGIAGVNVPRYYPVDGVWTTGSHDGPGMGYYGKIALVLPLSLLLAGAFYLAYPYNCRRLGFSGQWMRGAAVVSVIWAILFYVGEEGHAWVLDKQSLTGGGFFNLELVFYVLLLAAFVALMKIFLLAETESK